MTTGTERSASVDVDATIAATGGGRAAGPVEAEPGQRIGRYMLLAEIGRGAMGRVYAAYDEELDRKIALKLVFGSTDGTASARAEAQAMARVVHPNVVTVHDVGTFDGGIFIAMEHLPGGTFAERSSEDDDWRKTLSLYVDAGHGLSAAHAAGLVHRDFKPANVLFDASGRPKVGDFGLAAPADTGLDSSSPRVHGTPAYMAPEQFSGVDVDARADQFGFCVALYEALWGQRPFHGESLPELFASVVEGVAQEPPRSPVPAAVRRAVLRGLSADPAARFESMDALLAAIDLRHRRARIGWAVVLVGALASVASGMAFGRPPPPPACAGGAAEIAEVWDEARAAKVEAAVGARIGPRVVERVDRLAATWAVAFDRSCRLEPDASALEQEHRKLCLERTRRALDSAAGLLESSPEGAGQASSLIDLLVTPDECEAEASEAGLDDLLSTPEQASEVASILSLVDRSNALVRARDVKRARSVAFEAVGRAEALGSAYLRGWARLALGYVLVTAREDEEADSVLSRALADALEAEDAALAGQIAHRLMDSAVGRRVRHECERWFRVANQSPYATRHAVNLVSLLINYSYCKSIDGDLDAAIEVAREAVRVARGAGPRHAAALGDALFNLGAKEYLADRQDEAQASLGEAVELWGDHHPPSHPRSLMAQQMRAMYAGILRGELDEAAETFGQMRKVQIESLGAGHPKTIAVTIHQATFAAMAGRSDLAAELLEGSRDRVEALDREGNSELYDDWCLARATLHETLGQPEDALVLYDEVIGRLSQQPSMTLAIAQTFRIAVLVTSARYADADAAFVELRAQGSAIPGWPDRFGYSLWVLSAVGRGDRALARNRLAQIPADLSESRMGLQADVMLRVAQLASAESPQPAEVDRALSQIARLDPPGGMLRTLTARVLGRPGVLE